LGEQENPYDPDNPRHQVKLIFSLPGDDGPINQYAWLTASLHEKSKLFGVVRALLGKKPDGVIDLDSLKGRSCVVEIEHYESNGKERSKIVAYRAARPASGEAGN
jgi:hypothetical protein